MQGRQLGDIPPLDKNAVAEFSSTRRRLGRAPGAPFVDIHASKNRSRARAPATRNLPQLYSISMRTQGEHISANMSHHAGHRSVTASRAPGRRSRPAGAPECGLLCGISSWRSEAIRLPPCPGLLLATLRSRPKVALAMTVKRPSRTATPPFAIPAISRQLPPCRVGRRQVRIAKCKLPSANCQARIAQRALPSAHCQVADRRLQTQAPHGPWGVAKW
jgi:hypothetical protein